MKTISILKHIFLLAFICVIATACTQEAKQEAKNEKTTVQKTKSGPSVLNKIRSANKEKNALKDKEPITVQALENWLPESVKGMQKTKGGALEQDGITGVNVTYLDTNNQYGKSYANYIKLLIIDGHGQSGATAVLEHITIKNDGNATYDNTTVKEAFDQTNNTTTLKFFYNDRFGVEITGKGFEKEQLWEVFKAFKLDQLN